jgi:hypothetical protein
VEPYLYFLYNFSWLGEGLYVFTVYHTDCCICEVCCIALLACAAVVERNLLFSAVGMWGCCGEKFAV